MVSQRRNNVQGVQLFESADAHRSEVADVAIVAVAGRRISFFELSLPRARRRHHYVICALREMQVIVVIRII